MKDRILTAFFGTLLFASVALPIWALTEQTAAINRVAAALEKP